MVVAINASLNNTFSRNAITNYSIIRESMNLHISVAHRLIGTVSSQLLCNELYSQLDVEFPSQISSLCVA